MLLWVRLQLRLQLCTPRKLMISHAIKIMLAVLTQRNKGSEIYDKRPLLATTSGYKEKTKTEIKDGEAFASSQI